MLLGVLKGSTTSEERLDIQHTAFVAAARELAQRDIMSERGQPFSAASINSMLGK
jgi:hypothetical protein